MPFIVEPDQIAIAFMHQRQRGVLDLCLWPSLSIMPHPSSCGLASRRPQRTMQPKWRMRQM